MVRINRRIQLRLRDFASQQKYSDQLPIYVYLYIYFRLNISNALYIYRNKKEKKNYNSGINNKCHSVGYKKN